MLDQIEPKSLLILGAVGTYVLGFLFRNQIHTRLLVAIGSCLYIAYYSIAGPTPLWDAIIGSSLIALASFQGVVRLVLSRFPVMVPAADRAIWAQMGRLEPGLFRQLIKQCERVDIKTPTTLVEEGQITHSLWYLVEGEVLLERAKHPAVAIRTSGFLCEIAWLTGHAASATVIVQPGAALLKWDKSGLKRTVRRSQRLELALESLIAQDMARKLSKSRPIPETA